MHFSPICIFGLFEVMSDKKKALLCCKLSLVGRKAGELANHFWDSGKSCSLEIINNQINLEGNFIKKTHTNLMGLLSHPSALCPTNYLEDLLLCIRVGSGPGGGKRVE